MGDKADKKEKSKAEDQIKDLRKALEKDDIEDIKKKTEALSETAMALGAKLYEEAAKQNEAQANDKSEQTEKTEDKKDDNVKDAEYEEK